MIIFDLICNAEHSFEGWFQSQSSYDSQRENSLIACPHCGSSDVRRVPSAVHLAKSSSSSNASSPASSPKLASTAPGISQQAALVGAYQKLVSRILANCEDVGKDFAREARNIHYHEAPERSIRGEASSDDYEELRDEGIEVLRLPVGDKKVLN